MSHTPLPRGADLERLLENIEIAQYEDFYEALPSDTAKELGIGMHREGQTLYLTASGYDHPMFNRVLGVGPDPQNPDATPEIQLSRAAAHYKQAGVRRWMLQLLPHAEPDSFAEEAAKHGVIRLRGWSKHLGPAEIETLPNSDLRIIRIGSGASGTSLSESRLVDAWSKIVVQTFDLPSAFTAWLRALFGRKRWHLYMALDGETPVATGGMFLSESEAGVVGQLTFGSTLPDYRRRGAQSALIARRVQDAKAAGAQWIVCETDEELPDRPNPSTRNLTSLGFPVIYVRANWGPPKPEN